LSRNRFALATKERRRSSKDRVMAETTRVLNVLRQEPH
jgi:hypothetical protein